MLQFVVVQGPDQVLDEHGLSSGATCTRTDDDP